MRSHLQHQKPAPSVIPSNFEVQRRIAAKYRSPLSRMQHLQLAIGNRALQRVLGVGSENYRAAGVHATSIPFAPDPKGRLFNANAGEKIVNRSHESMIHRAPPPQTTAQQQTYNQALAQVRRLDPRMHGYLSAAPLNGAQTTILTNTQTSSGGVRTTTNFRLTIRTQSLPSAYALLQRHTVAQPTGTGTNRTRMVDMTMLIDPPTGTNAVNSLTETLYHEGLHMLIHMDGFLPATQQSPHRARLATYRRVAQGQADYALLGNELTALLLPHFRVQVLGSNPSGSIPQAVVQRIAALSRTAAQSIVTDLIEEKYIEDSVATTMRRSRQNNANLALQEIGNDLIHLGMTQQQLVSGTNLTAMRSIVRRATNILNAIDRHTSRAPTPAPSPAPGSNPSPAPNPTPAPSP